MRYFRYCGLVNTSANTTDTDGLVNSDPRVITVWSDIGCPWATLAMHTLREASAATEHEPVVDHRAFPLELYNRRATPKLVIDAEVVAIAGLVPEAGLFLWEADPATYPVSTLAALEAVQIAKDGRVGGLSVSAELDAALRRAMYTEQRCISILSEVEDVAHGIDGLAFDAFVEALHRGDGRRAVTEQWHASKAKTVQGSPQILTSSGVNLHNPGVDYAWTAPPQHGGVPRLHSYEAAWAHELLGSLSAG